MEVSVGGVIFVVLIFVIVLGTLFYAFNKSLEVKTAVRHHRTNSTPEYYVSKLGFQKSFVQGIVLLYPRTVRAEVDELMAFARVVSEALEDFGLIEDDLQFTSMIERELSFVEYFLHPPEWDAANRKSNLLATPDFRDKCTQLHREIIHAFLRSFTPLHGDFYTAPASVRVDMMRQGTFITTALQERIVEISRIFNQHGIPHKDPTERLIRDVPAQLSFYVPISRELRFQHMHVVASPGSGKSTLFSHFINHDLDAVARGEASVVVMESTRQLVTSLARLKRFAPGGDLEGKLLIIDAEDVEHPIALNLFNANTTDRTLSARDREAAYNATISLLDYVFRSLLGAELTSRMSTLLNFTINLLLKVPGATIDTMVDIMQPNGIERYRDVLNQCDPDTQLFFRVRFNEPGEMQRTKSHVVERLFAIKRIPAIARLFSSTESKLNLFDEMNQGRVILINADKDVLQEEGVEIYSRFFLALILMAAQKRTLIPQHERLATFVYIDEAQDVIRRDEKLPILLDQARKFRVGMVLAHQHLNQGFLPPVLSALYSSTAIKFAARLSDSDANTLARNMACDAQNLVHTPPFFMMLFARGLTHNAIHFKIPDVSFDRMPKMSDEEYDAIRDDLRRRYTGSTTPPPAPPPTQDPTKASEW